MGMENERHREASWTYDGLSVTPIWETKRRVPGGLAIDIIVHDKRSTIERATVNADKLKIEAR